MNELLDQRNLAKPLRLRRMVWIVSLAGVRWGAALGSAYAFPFFLASYPASDNIFSATIVLIIGAGIGTVYGLLLGSLHGLSLGLVTVFYFDPLGDEHIYRRALVVTSLLLNTGFGLLLETCYLALEDDVSLIEFLIFFGMPLLIATIASFKGTRRFAQWYINERFSAAAKFLDRLSSLGLPILKD